MRVYACLHVQAFPRKHINCVVTYWSCEAHTLGLQVSCLTYLRHVRGQVGPNEDRFHALNG